MKKISAVSFCLFFCFTLLSGCGQPKNDAAVSIKAIYDLYISGDTAAMTSLGVSKEEIKNAQDTYDESVRETIRANFSKSGQEMDTETLNDLCAARKEALAKLNATAEISHEDEGKATVVVHTTYFDESQLDEEAFFTAREAANQAGLSTLEQQQAYLMRSYTQNLIAAYENVTPSEKTTDIVVECVIQRNTWIPANMSSFGSDLALAVTGQNLE